MKKAITVCEIRDDKPGHIRQSQAFSKALVHAATDVEITVSAVSRPRLLQLPAFLRELRARRVDLLIGTGHRTHLALVFGRWLSGARSIVIMRPSLPLAWFDLAIVPRHDEVGEDKNVIESDGPLCEGADQPTDKDPNKGLILVGGVSSHYRFETENIAQQIASVLAANPGIHWTITNSRRTPGDLLESLTPLPSNANWVDAAQSGPGWLPAELARADRVWVTPDSMSMIYEALTFGCSVAVFELKAKTQTRVVRAVSALRGEGRLNRPASNRSTAPPVPFNEAKRVAQRVVDDFFRGGA